MDSTTSAALIAGGAGVLGALAGGGALLRSSRNERRDRQRSEHDAALVELYAAAMALGFTFHTWASLQPTGNILHRAVGHVGLALKTYGHPQRVFIDRIFSGGDRVWAAVGAALAVAIPDERPIVKAIEAAFAEWQMPKPMPPSWAPAIQALRELLERRALLSP